MAGVEPVEPGLVRVPDWRPDASVDTAGDHPVLRTAAVTGGRKP